MPFLCKRNIEMFYRAYLIVSGFESDFVTLTVRRTFAKVKYP